MAGHAHEFQCTNCQHWNYPMLRETMTGNFTVQCGNCKHNHYRYIKNGVVTEDRHNSAADHGDTVVVMRAACLPPDKRRKKGTVQKIREMVASGLAS